MPSSLTPVGIIREETRAAQPETGKEINEPEGPKSEQNKSQQEALHQDILKFNENTMKKLKIAKTKQTAMSHQAGSESSKDGKLEDQQKRLPNLKIRKIKSRKEARTCDQQEENAIPTSYSQPYKKFMKLKVPLLPLDTITATEQPSKALPPVHESGSSQRFQDYLLQFKDLAKQGDESSHTNPSGQGQPSPDNLTSLRIENESLKMHH